MATMTLVRERHKAADDIEYLLYHAVGGVDVIGSYEFPYIV
jgi:hypothetical protein